jgi:ABC-type branched-subunit amino acid transport system ATPase component
LSDEILRLENVSKRFGGVVVADNISLALNAGDVLGLIGPNGAGKTTLFNLISGVVQPDAGRIYMEGQPLAGSLHRRARAGVARTWQHMRLFRSMTVLENMLVGSRNYPGESMLASIVGTTSVKDAEASAHSRAMQVLDRMGLSHMANTIAVDLPFGQQKLVGLARALMNDGRCLLLDEPMAGVEGSSYEIMQKIVRDEASAGRAICIVEHNVSFIKELCTEAVFMSLGRILQRGSVNELTQSQELTELYFGAAHA